MKADQQQPPPEPGSDELAALVTDEVAPVRTCYRCTDRVPWPGGPILTEICRRERSKKAAKKAAGGS